MKTAKFIFDSSERNRDLFYRTRFHAPDSFIFFELHGKKYAVMSDLEIDRARSEAKVHHVLSLTHFFKKVGEKKKNYSVADVLACIFSDFHIKRLVVPQSSSAALVDALRRKGFRIEYGPVPFYPERARKTAEERKLIDQSQRIAFAAVRLVEQTLRTSKIRGHRLFYRRRLLTSEWMQQMVRIFLMERGYLLEDPIIACGEQACSPHDRGSGPLKAHQSIIVDIAPQSLATGYCGDVTRTFCRGRASEGLKRLYATVGEAQQLGFDAIRAGKDGKLVHREITTFFERQGYATGEKNGFMQGFFHGTGHGIGLEVHEEPARIRNMHYPLQAGNAMTVEPGLYYRAIGGVRLEDIIVVTKTGCKILGGNYPRRLEIL